jgi:hypothetical protein
MLPTRAPSNRNSFTVLELSISKDSILSGTPGARSTAALIGITEGIGVLMHCAQESGWQGLRGKLSGKGAVAAKV